MKRYKVNISKNIHKIQKYKILNLDKRKRQNLVGIKNIMEFILGKTITKNELFYLLYVAIKR